MREKAKDTPKRTESFRRSRISQAQVSIELHAMKLRAELGISEGCALSQEDALTLIPNCEIHAVKNVEGIGFDTLVEFHNESITSEPSRSRPNVVFRSYSMMRIR
jgi:hypothetical protein